MQQALSSSTTSDGRRRWRMKQHWLKECAQLHAEGLAVLEELCAVRMPGPLHTRMTPRALRELRHKRIASSCRSQPVFLDRRSTHRLHDCTTASRGNSTQMLASGYKLAVKATERAQHTINLRVQHTHFHLVRSCGSRHRHSHRSPAPSGQALTAMAGVGLFDLEDQFAFYGAYHNNKVNVVTHVICVWPLLFGGLIMLAYTQPLALPLPFMAALPLHEYMALNYCFVACVVYALFYVSLEYKSGSLAALLVLFCWIAANAVALHYPYTVGWKIATTIEIVGWTAQFITHGFYEKRSPALVDNLVQACLLAPYFVMLEALHSMFHYEPYTGFHKNVQYLVNQKKAEFRAKKTKKST